MERARFDKILGSAEIGTLIAALGTGIGREDFNVDKCRYHRIILMTDADVDGSHIRTLLLTFFFRQMPEIIERGYLYIAQPPLYRVKRGSSEVYLKDDPQLEDYLLSATIDEGAVFVTYSGAEVAGEDLRHLVKQSREIRVQLARLASSVPIHILEQAAIAAALDIQILSDPERAAAAAAYVARRLDALESTAPDEWQGAPVDDGGMAFSRTRRGVSERYVIDRKVIESAEARKINASAGDLQDSFAKHGVLKVKDREHPITGPVSLMSAVMELGRKGIAIQRYKGLGEMNADQLWQTTLDANARTLLQVRISHADDAEDLFSTLMGDTVETRREFIETNALNVANLDI